MCPGNTPSVPLHFQTGPYTRDSRSHSMPHHAIPCHTMPYHAIPCHTIPYHATPCHTMPYYSTLPDRTIHKGQYELSSIISDILDCTFTRLTFTLGLTADFSYSAADAGVLTVNSECLAGSESKRSWAIQMGFLE